MPSHPSSAFGQEPALGAEMRDYPGQKPLGYQAVPACHSWLNESTHLMLHVLFADLSPTK